MAMPITTMNPLRDPEDTAIPQFFYKEVQNPKKTEEAGRPIFDMRPYVRITIPGDQFHIPVVMVNDNHKNRWPEAWRRFNEEGEEEFVEGTPLGAWPLLNKAQVAELKALNIPTVEALADLNDKYLKMGLRDLRDQARAFIEASSGDSAVGAKMAALEKSLEERDALIEDMKETMDMMSVELKALQKSEKTSKRKNEDD